MFSNLFRKLTGSRTCRTDRPVSKTRLSARLGIEVLERRELMAAAVSAGFASGVLTVQGTPNRDIILLAQDNSSIQVKTWQTVGGPITSEAKGGYQSASGSISVKKTVVDIVYASNSYREGYDPKTGIGFTEDSGAGKVKSLRAGEVKEIRIYGLGGDDTIRLDDGKQEIVARAFLYGHEGKDFLLGGRGNDFLYGGIGNDTLYGLGGDDHLEGQEDHDLIDGGAGRDKLYGWTGNDTLYGIVGEDYLNGYDGKDTLHLTVNFTALMQSRQAALNYDRYAKGLEGQDTFHVSLDLGSMGRTLLGPIITQAQQVTRSFAPLMDALNQQVPLLSEFERGLTLGTLLSRSSDSGAKAYRSFRTAYDTINNLGRAASGAGTFYLGQFTVTSLDNIRVNRSTGLKALQKASPLANEAAKAGFQLTFVTSPQQMVQAVIGKNVPLLSYSLPQFTVGYKYEHSQNFLVGPVPVTATLSGRVAASLGATVQLSAAGLWQGDLTKGLAVSATASLSGGLGLRAGVGGKSAVAGASAGAGGGLTLTRSYTYDTNSRSLKSSGDVRYEGYLYAEAYVGVSLLKVKKEYKHTFASGRL